MANIPINTKNREQSPGDVESQELSQREGEQRVPGRIEGEPSRESELKKLEREILEAEPESPAQEQPSGVAPVQPQTISVKDPLTSEIENIMSEDLAPMYAKLSPEQKVVFKKEGERAAEQIRVMLEQVKVKAKSVIELIRRWLRLIPGVNKFFLEQEAKIKADKMLALHEKIHRQ